MKAVRWADRNCGAVSGVIRARPRIEGEDEHGHAHAQHLAGEAHRPERRRGDPVPCPARPSSSPRSCWARRTGRSRSPRTTSTALTSGDRGREIRRTRAGARPRTLRPMPAEARKRGSILSESRPASGEKRAIITGWAMRTRPAFCGRQALDLLQIEAEQESDRGRGAVVDQGGEVGEGENRVGAEESDVEERARCSTVRPGRRRPGRPDRRRGARIPAVLGSRDKPEHDPGQGQTARRIAPGMSKLSCAGSWFSSSRAGSWPGRRPPGRRGR